MMTRQEMFDMVVQRARANPTRSMGTRRMGSALQCFYRGQNSNKCFAGVLIPDELYDSDMEGNDIGQVTKQYSELNELLSGVKNYHFLINLQMIHDQFEPQTWEWRLSGFATKYELHYTKP